MSPTHRAVNRPSEPCVLWLADSLPLSRVIWYVAREDPRPMSPRGTMPGLKSLPEKSMTVTNILDGCSNGLKPPSRRAHDRRPRNPITKIPTLDRADHASLSAARRRRVPRWAHRSTFPGAGNISPVARDIQVWVPISGSNIVWLRHPLAQ